MARFLDWLGNILLALAALLITGSYASLVIDQGWDKLTAMLSPFNVVGWLAVAATLAPGLAAKWGQS